MPAGKTQELALTSTTCWQNSSGKIKSSSARRIPESATHQGI